MEEILIASLKKYSVEIISGILSFLTMWIIRHPKLIINRLDLVARYHHRPQLVSHFKLTIWLIFGLLLSLMVFLLYRHLGLLYPVLISIFLLFVTGLFATVWHSVFIAGPAFIALFIILGDAFIFASRYWWGTFLFWFYFIVILANYYLWIFRNYFR